MATLVLMGTVVPLLRGLVSLSAGAYSSPLLLLSHLLAVAMLGAVAKDTDPSMLVAMMAVPVVHSCTACCCTPGTSASRGLQHAVVLA